MPYGITQCYLPPDSGENPTNAHGKFLLLNQTDIVKSTTLCLKKAINTISVVFEPLYMKYNSTN